METKIIGLLIVVILCIGGLQITAEGENSNAAASDEIEILSEDLIRYTDKKDQYVSQQSSGPGPGYYDTSEYLIGSVAVGLIFMESNGAIDPNTENWNATEITNVQTQINQAMAWWQNQNQFASISVSYDVHTAVPTSYEPIIHPSALTDPTYEKLWVSEAMASLGYGSGDWMKRTRDYVNAMRTAKGTNWAFTVFLVDSSNDLGGDFSDGYFAYAFLGGPYLVMTYNNDGWGISGMNQVMAHETGHIFWATDEYDGYTEYSGYLNASDVEGSGCLMDTNALILSTGTMLQIGWRDTDGDNILDIIDTYPETTLNPYPQNFTGSTILTFTGNAIETPYPNSNPQPNNAGNDVTVNNIMVVLYRVDGGQWYMANPTDGVYNQPLENYTFTTIPLPHGPRFIEAAAINNIGNFDPTPANDTVTIDNPPATPTISGVSRGNAGTRYTYNCTTTDVDGDPLYYWVEWGDGTNTGWIGPFPPYYILQTNHTWASRGVYHVTVKSKDFFSMESPLGTLDVTMPRIRIIGEIEPLLMRILSIFPLLSYLLSIFT